MARSSGRPLFDAIVNGDVDEIKNIIRSHDIDLNAPYEGDSLPMQTVGLMRYNKCWATAAEVYEVLISCGAKPRASDKNGSTALMSAARGGMLNKACIELLRSSINDQDNAGCTALSFAVSSHSGFGSDRGNSTVVKALLAAGADPSIPDRNGNTALARAIAANKTGQNETIVQLIKDAIVEITARRWFEREFKYSFDKGGNLITEKR